MLSINTNIPSLIAQTSLKTSTQKLNTAIERMTTGYKINGAKDNAANYSISTNMGVKLSSYQVAEDNVASGLDLLSTAGGSLDLISDKLNRLRALAEQAANGTYGVQSLKAINTEANAIVDEIQRIYSTAEYNGIKLFGTSGGSFIEEVKQRDTSSMTKLSSIDPTQELTEGKYSISTAQELAQLAEMTNNDKIGENCEFVLANNIDLSAYSTGEGWTPIGYFDEDAIKEHYFSATFDGNGFVVSNLYINRPGGQEQGLFGRTDYISEIKNLGVENVDITGTEFIGGLVGDSYGTITNCYATGTVSGNAHVGGFVGYVSDGTITNCYTAVAVSGNSNVGGFAGYKSSGSITNCYATGAVSGYLVVGGLVGNNDYGPLTNSYATGAVSGYGKVGGLTGDNNDSITNCYSTGAVSGYADVGGLVGFDWNDVSFITNSYYNSATSGQSDTGKGDGVTTSELNNLISNGTLSEFSLKTVSTPQITTFQVGINSDSASQITLDTGFGLNVSSLRGIGQGTADYLSQIDTLLNTVSAKQTEYGAAENRLESCLEEISTQYENLVSSRSTLRDADIAEVSSEYIRQQILQQASATLLATANQTPALALQLL